MQKLWRKTLELLRKYPILWVPYVCADLLTSCIAGLRHLGTKAVFRWIITKHLHSVLGGDATTTNLDHAAIVKTELLSAPLQWLTTYVNACIYVVALVLTTALVAIILRGEKPDLAAALPALRTYPRRILLFALILLALTMVLTAFIGLPLSYVLNVKYLKSQILISVAIVGIELLGMLCSAWIMAPIAVALIRPKDTIAVSAEPKRLARDFAILSGAATIALSQLLSLLIVKLVAASHLVAHVLPVIWSLNSLIVNSPFILLFIALALIAAEDSLEIQSDRTPKTRKLFEALMPLHFGQGREP